MEHPKECASVLRKVMAIPSAYYFLQPVDPIADGVPQYTQIVERPMDLGTVKATLARSGFASDEAFAADMRLVFANAFLFNGDPDAVVYKAAAACASLFEDKWSEFLAKQHAKAQPQYEQAPPPQPVAMLPPTRPLALALSQTLRSVMSKKEAKMYFNQPVDPVALGVPHYPRIITEPLDLGTIKSRLKAQRYSDLNSLARDVRLVFSNATTFNADPKDPVHVAALELLATFESLYGDLQAEREQVVREQEEPPTKKKKKKKEEEPDSLVAWRKVMKHVLKQPEAYFFMEPVDPVAMEIPDYFDFVTKPMDLGTLQEQLEDGFYGNNTAAFSADLCLVFKNAMAFNTDPKNEIHVAAKRMLTVSKAKLKVWCKNLPNEQEIALPAPVQQKECPGYALPWRRVLETLLAHDLGFIFAEAVDPVVLEIPDYFEIVTNPMDLGTIMSKLDSGEVKTAQQFAELVRTVFNNAMVYNKDPVNEIHAAAAELLSEFESEWTLLGCATKKRSVVVKEPVKEPAPSLGPRMGAAEAAVAQRILETVRRVPNATGFFGQPVDFKRLNIPDYLVVIEDPMDFATVERKMATEYSTLEALKADLRLVFENAKTYNIAKSNVVHQCAISCERELERVEFEMELDSLPTREKEERRLKSSAAEKMRRCLHEIMRRDASKKFFNAPVDLNVFTDYAAKVVDPIDFSTIDSRIESYPDAEAFAAELRRVLDNAMTYTTEPNLAVHAEARKLKATLDGAFKRHALAVVAKKEAPVARKRPTHEMEDRKRPTYHEMEDEDDPQAAPLYTQAETDEVVQEQSEDEEEFRDRKRKKKQQSLKEEKAVKKPVPIVKPPVVQKKMHVLSVSKAGSPPPSAAEPVAAIIPASSEEHDSVFGGEDGDALTVLPPVELDLDRVLAETESGDWTGWASHVTSRKPAPCHSEERLALLWEASRGASLQKREVELEAERVRANRIAQAQLAVERRQQEQLAALDRRRLEDAALATRRGLDEERTRLENLSKRAAEREKKRKERERTSQVVDLEKQRTTVTTFLDKIGADKLRGFADDLEGEEEAATAAAAAEAKNNETTKDDDAAAAAAAAAKS